MGKKHAALNKHKLACHNDKFAGNVGIHLLRLFNIFHILIADKSYWYICNAHLVLADKSKQKVKRSLELIEAIGYLFNHI